MNHRFLFMLVLAFALSGGSCTPRTPNALSQAGNPPAILRDLPPQVRSFIERKEREVFDLAKKLRVKPDQPTLDYFHHARKGEYRAASRIYQDLRERGGKVESPRFSHLPLPLWDPLLEVQLTLDAYAAGAGKFATAYGEEIARSIPRGSIYFGGTDTGRGLAAAFCGDSFFVLTQNQLADGQHLNYLRAAFGDRIKTPSDEDMQHCFVRYLGDARRRHEHDQQHPDEPPQLKPGESVKMVDGKPVVSGQVAVMMINGLAAGVMFDANPKHEFYIEESFALDWMSPHLTPHGFIMKINRESLPSLPAGVMATNRSFWMQHQARFIGGWLTEETPVREVCDFVKRTFLRKDLTGFEGDPEFVRNAYATAAYSKLRVSQAGLFAWRAGNSRTPEDCQAAITEADLAFRQAFAFCPTDSEPVFRFANFLVQQARFDDALLIAGTAVSLDPKNQAFHHLRAELDRLKNSGPLTVP